MFHHVQGKPINHRIPQVYCGTPLCRLRTSNKSRGALIFRDSSPSVEQTFATFANYWPVLTCTLPLLPARWSEGEKQSKYRERARRKGRKAKRDCAHPRVFALSFFPVFIAWRRGGLCSGESFARESIKLFYYRSGHKLLAAFEYDSRDSLSSNHESLPEDGFLVGE